MPYISNKNLIVSAEQMDSNERITGYVCACAFCLESHNNRPTGLLTTPDGLNGGIRVFLDTMYFESPTEPISLYDSFVLKTDTSHGQLQPS